MTAHQHHGVTKTLRFGTWNLEYGADPTTHVAIILWVFEHLHLDVLFTQESKDYARLLQTEAAKLGHHLVVDYSTTGSDQQLILVRGGLEVIHERLIKGTGTGWHRKGGGTHAPSYDIAAVVEGCTMLSEHDPSGVHTRARRLVGPVLKRLAYRAHANRVAGVIRHHHPIVTAGDRNNPPTAKGAGSPAWVAEKGGGLIVAPREGTHHGHVIDYPIVRGVHVTDMRVHPCGDLVPEHLGGRRPFSDHSLVTFTGEYVPANPKEHR